MIRPAAEREPSEEPSALSARAYQRASGAASWEEIWEAGPYYERVAEILEDAREYAVFTGWQIDSRLPMRRPARPGSPRDAPPRETLMEKVLRLCEAKPAFRFYFLMWDHAYFYVLERESWQGRVWENVHPRVHFIFDNRHPIGAAHHEKIAIVDGRVAFVGGIDLCDERWDSPQHLYLDPRRSLDWRREHHGPYHDLAVQVGGPVCGEIQRHVAERWRSLSSIPFPDPPAAGQATARGHRVYVSRTISSIDAVERRPLVREIEFLLRDLIRGARRRIIIEGQYFWSSQVNDLLISKFEEMRGRDFEVVLVLAELGTVRSLTRLMTSYEMTLLAKLRSAADRAGVRLIAGAPYVHAPAGSTGAPPRPVYIHSKLVIVDDRYVSIGTANLASRALRMDTEIALTLEARDGAERAHVGRLARAVLRHWGIHPPAAGERRADVRIRQFRARSELQRLARGSPWRSPWGTLLPYQAIFDPPLPWLYILKRRFRALSHRRRGLSVAALSLAWALGAIAALGFADAWAPEPLTGSWRGLYEVLLASVWLLPVPFTVTALYASLHLGGETAARVSVVALWVASALGYLATRAFPTAAARYFRKTAPLWLPARIGLRSFPALVSVLADPRVSLRSKIAYQGLYCVPFPWFALATWLVLASAAYLACRWFPLVVPPAWAGFARHWPWTFFAGMLAWVVGKFAVRLWRSAG